MGVTYYPQKRLEMHVTKSEVKRPHGSAMLKVKENIDIGVSPNKSCTMILTGFPWLRIRSSDGRL